MLLKNILCKFGLHTYEMDRTHPYSFLGAHVRECKRCHRAQAEEGDGGWHDVPCGAVVRFNERQEKRERDAKTAELSGGSLPRT